MSNCTVFRTVGHGLVPQGRALISLVLGLALFTLGACGSTPDDSSGSAISPSPATPTSELTTTPPPPTIESPTTPPPTSAPPTSAPPTSAPPTREPPTSAPTTTPPTSTPRADTTLRAGDSGPAVLALQQRLTDLGYWLGTPDGAYGSLTTQAVYALQGVADIDRDGRVGPQTRAALAAGVRPIARSRSGTVTEIDRAAGVISFVQDGKVTLALHTSTGTFEKYTHEGRTMLADTPKGRFSVAWSYNGWREGDLGRLYRPRYFHPDGIAVHGYASVPAFPASHGCARVSIAAMDVVWSRDLMPQGSAVWVL